MNWRPENWKEIVNDYKDPDATYYSSYDFEAGADAMYQPACGKGRKDEREVLKEQGEHIEAYQTFQEYPQVSGTYVFIPDKE